MPKQKQHSTGLTRDTGWQIGLRRTLDVPVEIIWEWMLSASGREIWMGEGPDIQFVAGQDYKLLDGTSGRIKVYQPGSHWRITRNPPDPAYRRPSLVQIRIIGSGDKTTVAFHEEHLPSESERQTRKTFYLDVVDKMKDALGLD